MESARIDLRVIIWLIQQIAPGPIFNPGFPFQQPINRSIHIDHPRIKVYFLAFFNAHT